MKRKTSTVTYPKDWNKDLYDSDITLAITPPYAGWFTLVFLGTSRGGLVAIDCSNIYDPLLGLIRWFHKIASGDLPARVSVNEEGRVSVLYAQPIPGREDWIEFQIKQCSYDEAKRGTGEQVFLCRANRRQLVGEFYRRFVLWQKSDCKADAWPSRKVDVSRLKKFAVSKPRRAPGTKDISPVGL